MAGTDDSGQRLMRFKRVGAGEWVQPIAKGYLMQCCDCGLVHRMDFRIHNGRVQLRAWRHTRRTRKAVLQCKVD